MRHSNHDSRGRRLPTWAVGLLAFIIAGCGSSAVGSPSPSAAATPAATPDPHLSEPVAADDIYRAFGKGGVVITAINANLGQGNPNIVKQINANLGGWPLRITQYKSGDALRRVLDWTVGQSPGGDEAPYAFAGLNILIQFGPISARAPSIPDAGRLQAAASIVAILDPLLWPLAQRSVVAIPIRTPIPVATPIPTAKPTAQPTKAPSKAPSKKP
jgi:hypothetical protein